VLGPTGVIKDPALFFVGLATVHLGLLMVVARRHLLAQVAALVGIENGLIVVAAAVAGTLPTLLEWGLLADLLLAATVLVWLSGRIHRAVRSSDVTALRRLRG
jgi:hydrogenase-4 component E